eukprot:tig00001160_g7336.t1
MDGAAAKGQLELPFDRYRYSSELFDCCGDCTCLYACVCPQVQLGLTDSVFDGSSACLTAGEACLLDAFCCMGTVFIGLDRRRKVQRGYGIEAEAGCAECLRMLCCRACAIAQDAREVMLRGPVARQHLHALAAGWSPSYPDARSAGASRASSGASTPALPPLATTWVHLPASLRPAPPGHVPLFALPRPPSSSPPPPPSCRRPPRPRRRPSGPSSSSSPRAPRRGGARAPRALPLGAGLALGAGARGGVDPALPVGPGPSQEAFAAALAAPPRPAPRP